ncbi:MAG: ECF transporter S component [Oscillospiraceae bacterium]|nr:ECF transporter S component [Oscillospiraceae bacterium]
MQNSKTKTIVTLAMLCAIAYTVMNFKIPIVLFLKYEPKDVIIILGGFLYGPLSAFIISAVVSLIEMVTVSDTGPLGAFMNVLSSCTFACTASFIYHKRKTLGGAVTGLIVGVVLMTGIMIPANYLLTPIYMANEFVTAEQLRQQVVGMFLTVFVPFNLFKGAVNAIIVMFLFKPLVTALHRAGLIQPAIVGTRSAKIKWVFIITTIIIAISVFFILQKLNP